MYIQIYTHRRELRRSPPLLSLRYRMAAPVRKPRPRSSLVHSFARSPPFPVRRATDHLRSLCVYIYIYNPLRPFLRTGREKRTAKINADGRAECHRRLRRPDRNGALARVDDVVVGNHPRGVDRVYIKPVSCSTQVCDGKDAPSAPVTSRGDARGSSPRRDSRRTFAPRRDERTHARTHASLIRASMRRYARTYVRTYAREFSPTRHFARRPQRPRAPTRATGRRGQRVGAPRRDAAGIASLSLSLPS